MHFATRIQGRLTSPPPVSHTHTHTHTVADDKLTTPQTLSLSHVGPSAWGWTVRTGDCSVLEKVTHTQTLAHAQTKAVPVHRDTS